MKETVNKGTVMKKAVNKETVMKRIMYGTVLAALSASAIIGAEDPHSGVQKPATFDMSLEGNVQASENQMKVMDALYDSLGDIPGDWGRHHRCFRDHLRGRFEGIDHQLKELEARLKGNHQLQHESVANLTNQRQTLSQRFAAMEARMITLEEGNKVLKLDNQALKTRLSVLEMNQTVPVPGAW